MCGSFKVQEGFVVFVLFDVVAVLLPARATQRESSATGRLWNSSGQRSAR